MASNNPTPPSLWTHTLKVWPINAASVSSQFPPSSHPSGDRILLPSSLLQPILAAADNATSASASASASTPISRNRGNPAPSNQTSRPAQPLTFKLICPNTGRIVYAGVREFTAPEGVVIISPWLTTALGIDPTEISTDTQSTADITITLHLVSLAKGTSVSLHQLEPPHNHDAPITPPNRSGETPNWKPILESLLRQQFTTLTRGQILAVPVSGQKQPIEFLVEHFGEADGAGSPDGVCIVDTDLVVDILSKTTIEPQELRQNGVPGPSSHKNAYTTLNILPSGEGEIRLSQMTRIPTAEVVAHVSESSYASYLITGWQPAGLHRGSSLLVTVYDDGPLSPPNSAIESSDQNSLEGKAVRWDTLPAAPPDHTSNSDRRARPLPLELFASPLSTRHRAIPRQNRYVWTDLECRLGEYTPASAPPPGGTIVTHTSDQTILAAHIEIPGTNVEIDGAEGVRVSVYFPGRADEYDTNQTSSDEDEAPVHSHRTSPRRLFRLAVRVKHPVVLKSPTSAPEPEQLSSTPSKISICSNCRSPIPAQSLTMHSVFCTRNIIPCKQCPALIRRSDPVAHQEHWHCQLDGCAMFLIQPTEGSDYIFQNANAPFFRLPSACGFSPESRDRHMARFHTDLWLLGLFSPIGGTVEMIGSTNKSTDKDLLLPPGTSVSALREKTIIISKRRGQKRPTRVRCPDCVRFLSRSVHSLARHRTSICPAKQIICRFCRLEVSQGEVDRDIDLRKKQQAFLRDDSITIPKDSASTRGLSQSDPPTSASAFSAFASAFDTDTDSDVGTDSGSDPGSGTDSGPDLDDNGDHIMYPSFQTVRQSQLIVISETLTPHEFQDGTRTTDCHICNRPIRMFELEGHVKHHRYLQDQKNAPGRGLCANRLCSAVLPVIQDPFVASRVASIIDLPSSSSSMASSPSPYREDDGAGEGNKNLILKISASLCIHCAPGLMVTTDFSQNMDTSEAAVRLLHRRVERVYIKQQQRRRLGASAPVPGCGRAWCRNWACAAGRMGIKLVSPASRGSTIGADDRKLIEIDCLDEHLTDAFFDAFLLPGLEVGGRDLSEWSIPATSDASTASAAATASTASTISIASEAYTRSNTASDDTSTTPITPLLEPGVYLCSSSRAIQARSLEARIQVGLSKVMNPGLLVSAAPESESSDGSGSDVDIGPGTGPGPAIPTARNQNRSKITQLLQWWSAALDRTGATDSGLGQAEVVVLASGAGSGSISDGLLLRVDWRRCTSGISPERVVQAGDWLRENAPAWVTV